MEKPKSYCEAVLIMDKNNLHRIYHDQFYGFPIEEDDKLFGRLILEINQAGLSWSTILNKEENFRKAYKNFNIKKIASFKEKETKFFSFSKIVKLSNSILTVDADIAPPNK